MEWLKEISFSVTGDNQAMPQLLGRRARDSVMRSSIEERKDPQGQRFIRWMVT